MPIPGLLEPRGQRPLGRHTAATVAHWASIMREMPVAPSIMRGELPRKSPPIWRFINPRVHHQIIGMCVGRGGTRMVECLLRIPPDATPDAMPYPAVDLSSLYTYWIAREYSRNHGIRLGPDGAIVSHMILAEHEKGLIPLGMWPDDARHENEYSDRRPPVAADFAAGKTHLVEQYANLDTKQKILEYVSMGFPVAIGVPITEGWLQTDDAGHFRDAGKVVGGHCTTLIGYDMDAGWVADLNSWPQWGLRSDDPMFGGESEGYTNIGYMTMEDFDRLFSDTAMEQGESEAVVANTVKGFDKPLIQSFAGWYVSNSMDKPSS